MNILHPILNVTDLAFPLHPTKEDRQKSEQRAQIKQDENKQTCE
jgi:hypothetical protein